MSARDPQAAELPKTATRSHLPPIARSTRQRRCLNIGLLIPTLQSGGAERVCSLLANHWARKGHHVTLMTFADASSDAFAVSTFVQRVVLGNAQLTSGAWNTLTKNAARIRSVRHRLTASKIDVAVSFMSVSNTCLALAGQGLRTVCVGTERTYPPAVSLPRLAELARWSLYGWLDAVVAQTDDSGQWLKSHTRAKSVAVIPNPVELPLLSRMPLLDPAALRCSGSRMLLAVGRLSAEKNFERLIRAFLQASDTLPSEASPSAWQLAVVGEGPLRFELTKLVEQLGAQSRVLLPGHAGNMGDWYQAADAFALTSDFEGYPNGLLEALAYGVPSVACDCLTGPRELIRSDVNGFLVPVDSHAELVAALCRVMGDAALRERLAKRANLTLESHAIESISDRWESVFAQAMATRKLA